MCNNQTVPYVRDVGKTNRQKLLDERYGFLSCVHFVRKYPAPVRLMTEVADGLGLLGTLFLSSGRHCVEMLVAGRSIKSCRSLPLKFRVEFKYLFKQFMFTLNKCFSNNIYIITYVTYTTN